jgi:hypothetical protein
MSSDGYWAGVFIAAMILIAKNGMSGIAYLLFLAPLSWLYVIWAVIERVFR